MEAFAIGNTSKSQSRSIVKLTHYIAPTQSFLESEVPPQIQHASSATSIKNN
jgi:hypothetical protein